MEQGMSAIIIALFILFLFVPVVFLKTMQSNTENTKNNIHFSAMALADCIEIEEVNYADLSYGYERYMENYTPDASNIKIDEQKLLVEFNNVLFKNSQDPKLYAKVQENIVAKILIYNDRFLIAAPDKDSVSKKYDYKNEFNKYKDGKAGKFNAPYYFTYKHPSNGNTYYLNTKNDTVKDIDGNVVNIDIKRVDRNKEIINKINKVISDYTNGLIIDFPNPDNLTETLNNIRKKELNFFDGVTFMVIYKEDKALNVRTEDLKFKSYAVAGYTLK